jgi:hypothetical protein
LPLPAPLGGGVGRDRPLPLLEEQAELAVGVEMSEAVTGLG